MAGESAVSFLESSGVSLHRKEFVMDYDFGFKISTDRALTDQQIGHVQAMIANEIRESGLGYGILNAEDEPEETPEVRLIDVQPSHVDMIFHDGTTIRLDTIDHNSLKL